jgi:hypothetical protein
VGACLAVFLDLLGEVSELGESVRQEVSVGHLTQLGHSHPIKGHIIILVFAEYLGYEKTSFLWWL